MACREVTTAPRECGRASRCLKFGGAHLAHANPGHPMTELLKKLAIGLAFLLLAYFLVADDDYDQGRPDTAIGVHR